MYLDLNSKEWDWRIVYHLCISFITPRPIALVSTISADGKPNLAPFSFYNMVSANPPVVIVCTGLRRDGSKKDTLRNIEQTGEFAVATVTADLAERMVKCAADLPYGESEFTFSGLTPTPAALIGPPLVKEAQVNIECRLRQLVSTGDQPGASTVIFGDIVAIHVNDAMLDETGKACDPEKLITVGRLGGSWYIDSAKPYALQIPKVGR